MLIRNVSFYCLFLIMLFGCKTSNISNQPNLISDNKYDSEFPSLSVSKELSYISKTVKKLDILAFYATYYFPSNSNIIKNDINDSLLKLYSDNLTIDHESVSGTASIIYNKNNLIGLLTCAHVVDFPDSVYSFYDHEDSKIQTLSIKIKQQNHVSGFITGEPLEITAIDKVKDIAILSKRIVDNNDNIATLNYPRGKVKELQWGSIVYIMGFPLGNLMVTRAIVSLTDKIKTGVFVTDALYNHGISGSPVFAIRDGVPNFELIGMASSSAAQASNLLVPNEDYKQDSKILSKYTGEIFVDNTKLISYGVTYSVTIDEIITFINSNKENLTREGYNMNNFFM